MKQRLTVIILLLMASFAQAQILHSHNDYRQRAPFWEAYTHGMGSIEVDLYLRNNSEIVVCHDSWEVDKAPLFEQLYIAPLVSIDTLARNFTLLIDLKHSAEKLMQPLADMLAKYPKVFHKNGVNVVISGSRPPKQDWARYADYIYFDGQTDEQYSQQELDKVYMISQPLRKFTQWNGKGMIPPVELASIEQVVAKAHSQGKLFRFWGCGDNVNTWLVLHKIGVDVINTDKVAACSAFFGAFGKNSYTLEKPQPTYTPTFKSDGKDGRVKNVIFIIGDGMSINQITAAEIANRGVLTLLNLMNIGFIKTWSLNANNTDSAGAGSAMATGHKTNNRHISTLPSGENVANASEVFSADGRKIGIISSGDITDATPAAQYAHSVERDNSQEIAAWITKNKVDFMAGANIASFNRRKDGRDLTAELRGRGCEVVTSVAEISNKNVPTLCLDDKIGEWTTEQEINSLAELTARAIEKLDNPKGFYLMVESAKIDHAGHSNNMRQSVLETLKLDAVVEQALRFADKDGNTLVVVTGDHETGGLIILDGERDKGTVNGFYVSDDHTGSMIPVFAYGVGSATFRGVYENTDIFKKIETLFKSIINTHKL